jgi:trimeric autotransporter adhesin
MNPLSHLKKAAPVFLVALACFGLLPQVQAVEPTAPDTALAGGNTRDGQNALFSLTTGTFNSALGFDAVAFISEASFDTGVGTGALFFDTGGTNTAVGAAALLSNKIASFNNAVGAFALFNNDSDGTGAAEFNNAHGRNALLNNVHGDENDAFGDDAMEENTTGAQNTAMGDDALDGNTTGNGNTAMGKEAGNSITTGSNNVCIGHNAGIGIVDGSDIIAIGTEAAGQFANVGPTCFIGGIDGEPTGDAGSTVPVLIDSNNNLGTFASSRRVKHDIKPMDKASDVILALKPVSFKYNHDKKGTPCFGLIAEEVAQVDPDLVVRDKNGEPWTVRYEQINAMLLNEFLKEHQTVQEQGATIARQQKQIDALAAGLQKVSGQLEASKPAPQVVNNP